jgi:TetR/AcrR family transcriptional repressor of nem operon
MPNNPGIRRRGSSKTVPPASVAAAGAKADSTGTTTRPADPGDMMADDPNAARSSRGELTRRDIINVARRLFSEHGYHNSGISDIQHATGLTKGAFYHHFRSKEELALDVLDTARADYAEHLIGPAMSLGTPAERITALLDGGVDLNARPEWCNCQMVATLCAELGASDERLRLAVAAMQTGMIEILRDQFEQARAAGELAPAVEPEAAAQLVVNVMTGSLLARKMDTDRTGLNEVMGLVRSLLIREPDLSSA